MYTCTSYTHLWLQFYLLHVTPVSNSIWNSIRSNDENSDQSTVYDLGYEARLYMPRDGGIMLYPVIYFFFILTEITLTIIITNLLIGKVCYFSFSINFIFNSFIFSFDSNHALTGVEHPCNHF